MQKAMRICLALLALAVLMTGCSAKTEENPMPSPTVSPSATATPMATEDAAQSEKTAFTPVGEDAQIMVGDVTLTAKAYYMGEEDMLLPVAQTAEALGWTAQVPDAAGAVEMKLTRQGEEDIVVAYTAPEDDAPVALENVTVRKGGEDVDLQDVPMAFIDGTLYAAEAFFDRALEEIDVAYDEGTRITLEAAA